MHQARSNTQTRATAARPVCMARWAKAFVARQAPNAFNARWPSCGSQTNQPWPQANLERLGPW